MARFELPPDLTPEEQRAVLAALERAFGAGRRRVSPWALAGRVEAMRLGRLQARRETAAPWPRRGDLPFARRGTDRLTGRGDAK